MCDIFTWLIFPWHQNSYSARTVAVFRWLFIHSCPTKRVAWLYGLKLHPAEGIIGDRYCYEIQYSFESNTEDASF